MLLAIAGVPTEEFGHLMNASYASLREDFEASVPALDFVVEHLQDHPAVYGARLTGAGWGGACVALVEMGRGGEAKTAVLEAYEARGYRRYSLV